MTALPILPRSEKHLARQQYCCSGVALPDFYMSDFTVLGLIVDDYERTLQVFSDSRLPLQWSKAGAAYSFKDADQLQDLVSFLRSRGIRCDLANIADQIYQG